MEVYTVKLSSKEFTHMRGALAMTGSRIMERQEEAQESGNKELVLNMEIARLENQSCHLALDGAEVKMEDNG